MAAERPDQFRGLRFCIPAEDDLRRGIILEVVYQILPAGAAPAKTEEFGKPLFFPFVSLSGRSVCQPDYIP